MNYPRNSDSASTLEGLVIEGSRDLNLIWTRDLGYVRFLPLIGQFQPNNGDWVRARFNRDSVRIISGSTTRFTIREIDVLEWELLKPPCPIFLHYESGYPCMNVFAERCGNNNDQIRISLLNVSIAVSSSLQQTLLESQGNEFVAILHFCYFDEPLPYVLTVSPFIVRKGIVTTTQLNGSSGCELSVGMSTFAVESHVVNYTESVYRTSLKLGQRIKAVFCKSNNNEKETIFYLLILKNNGSELVHPARDLEVKMEFKISPIDDKRYDDCGDIFYLSIDDIPAYLACDLPKDNSQILVSATRVSNSSGYFIWRIIEYYPCACEPYSSLQSSFVRENPGNFHINVIPFQASGYQTSTTLLSTGSRMYNSSSVSDKALLLERPPSIVQREPPSITSASHGIRFKENVSSSLASSVKKRTSFDDHETIHTFVENSVKQPFSIRSFIAEEESLRKPLINLHKKPVRSILKSSTVNDEQGVDVLTNEWTFDEETSLSLTESSSAPSSSFIDSTNIGDLHFSTYLEDGDCGCNVKWLNYIKNVPRPEDIHSETVSKEAVLFISCHRHNVGTPDEIEVWRGYACNSFSGVIELIPSTYHVPIKVNLGTWVVVSILKIITKQPSPQIGLMIRHNTIWNYHTNHTATKYEVKEKGNHRWIQVTADLSRLARSNNMFIASDFGNVFVPSKLLDPFPYKVYRQLFHSWIEPLARPIKLNNEMVYWKAVTIKLYKEISCDEHDIQVQKASRMATVEWGPDSSKPSWREMCKIPKAPRDYQKRKQEALKHNQILVPRSERVEDLQDYIHLLGQRSSEIPDLITEDIVLPCTLLLDSPEKKGHKIRQVIKILVETLLLKEESRNFMEKVHYTDPIKKLLVSLLNVNLSFMRFEEYGSDFEMAYRHFVTFNDVSASDTEEDSS